MTDQNRKLGYVCAIGAQVLWGVFPIYFHLLRSVDALELVAHRSIWSFVILLGVFTLAKFIRHRAWPRLDELKAVVSDRKLFFTLCLAAVLIAINWIVFVWSVNHDHKVDASLGYYICPQVLVLLGVLFLGERLKPLQWCAVGLAALGVGYMVRSSASMPSVSIALALSFGFYALIKKNVKAPALSGLTIETGFLTIPALIFLAGICGYYELPEFVGSKGGGSVFTNNALVNVLLIGSGLTTIVPLALYATAVKHLPLSTIGLLQFVGPTIQFCIGIFLFSEKFDRSRLIGFVFVWIGVGIFLFTLRAAKQLK